MKSHLKFGASVVAALGMLAAMLGCSGIPAMPTAEEPTFLGTWKTTESSDSDGETTTTTYVLTFTKDRYIQYVESRTGTTGYVTTTSGTWSRADGYITRTWADDDDGTKDAKKAYRWMEDGQVLSMEPWHLDDEGSDRSARYTRVKDPVAPLAGVWSSTVFFGDYRVTETLTFGGSSSNDSFVYRYEKTGSSEDSWEITGTWMPDPDRELAFLVTVGNNGRVERWAYAPTDDPDTIAVSFTSFEHNPEEYPYGSYTMRVTKERPTEG